MSQSDKIKEMRLDLITKVSKRRRWSFGDTNPYFDEVYSYMPKIEANTIREYKIKLPNRNHFYHKYKGKHVFGYVCGKH